MKRCHVYLRGRVQGVWFRGSTREEAVRLGVTGWVRNLPDGRVELVAEGEDALVDALVEWCRRGGPPMARVDDLEISWEAPSGSFTEFNVTG